MAGIDWGSVPDWLGAISTGGALIAAATAIIREGRQRNLERIESISAGSRRFTDPGSERYRYIVRVSNGTNRSITIDRLLVSFMELDPLGGSTMRAFRGIDVWLNARSAYLWDVEPWGVVERFEILTPGGLTLTGVYMQHTDATGTWHQELGKIPRRENALNRRSLRRKVQAVDDYLIENGCTDLRFRDLVRVAHDDPILSRH